MTSRALCHLCRLTRHSRHYLQREAARALSVSHQPQRNILCSTTCPQNTRSITMKAHTPGPPRDRPKAQTTIDHEELSHFSKLADEWWDETGIFEPLHALNEMRVPLIRDALMDQHGSAAEMSARPLEGKVILDVGCGGGILSEPLARLGAQVVGIDAVRKSIKVAQYRLSHEPSIAHKVKYIEATVEDLVEAGEKSFDAVVASEVLEHVAEPAAFVQSCCKVLKPGGSVFFTTINKTAASYALGVLGAEQVLRLVPQGTHDWEKFISPEDLQFMLKQNNFSTRLVHGMWYNLATHRWAWCKDTSINYAIHAVNENRVVNTDEAKESSSAENQTSSKKCPPGGAPSDHPHVAPIAAALAQDVGSLNDTPAPDANAAEKDSPPLEAAAAPDTGSPGQVDALPSLEDSSAAFSEAAFGETVGDAAAAAAMSSPVEAAPPERSADSTGAAVDLSGMSSESSSSSDSDR